MNVKYFDHSATTPVKEDVLKSMIPYFSINFGNCSSIYSIGRKSKKAIEESRKLVAESIGAKSKEIYFTSCGSESNNLIIKGICYANRIKGNHIITTKIEHPSVLNTCKKLEMQGFEVTYLNVDENGLVDINQLKNSIRKNTILISVMFANNEIGTIEPINEIGKIAKEQNIIFHTDSVQAIGNVKINVNNLNIDALSMSAHKFYGPKGIGAAYVRKDINFEKIQDGGHQERDKRAGTENVPLIVGLGKAIKISTDEIEKHTNNIRNLRDYYISKIEEEVPNVKLNGDRNKRLPCNANFSFKDVDSEELLLKLDSKGICASAGSACSSGSIKPSHVLTSIGLNSKLAEGALRTTFGEDNTKEDIDYLVECIKEEVKRQRKRSTI